MATTEVPSAQEVKAAIEVARVAFYAAAGYTNDVGDIDRTAFRHKIADVLVKNARVTGKADKPTRAMKKGQLALAVFGETALVGAQYEEASEIEKEAWKAVLGNVWRETEPDYSGAVQKLIGDILPGCIMIRARVSDGEASWAAYVTDDEKLIWADFADPLKAAQRKAAEKTARNLAMVANRQPKLAARAQAQVAAGAKTASDSGKLEFQLALETSTSAADPAVASPDATAGSAA